MFWNEDGPTLLTLVIMLVLIVVIAVSSALSMERERSSFGDFESGDGGLFGNPAPTSAFNPNFSSEAATPMPTFAPVFGD